jgi:hypothetical protein
MRDLGRLFLIVVISGSITHSESFARGGGGGVARGGGGARPAVQRPSGGGAAAHTPSMSRPAGKPVASKPSVPLQINKPSIGNGGPSGRPNITKPDAGGKLPLPDPNKPNSLGNRPNLNDKKPGIAANRPNLGDKMPGNSNRPNLPGNNHPSAGDLNDFLNLPGQQDPGPRLANRPNVGDKVNIGDKTQIGDRVNIGDRNKVGDVTINAGNNVSINRQNNINSIHNKYNNNNYRRPFGAGYWGGAVVAGPGWRWHGGWNNYPGNWCWRPCPWAAFGTWFVWQWAQPIPYNYGTTVVYRDNYVYIEEKQVATTEEYYQQAVTVTQSAPANIDESKIEWMPLGVFAVTEEDATDTGMMVQLAVSKEGIIAGTFYNELTNSSRPVEGMVDRETQRAAWKFADGKNADIVMETGISNLTKDDSTALVHFGPDKTQTWLIVRLPAPEEETQQ